MSFQQRSQHFFEAAAAKAGLGSAAQPSMFSSPGAFAQSPAGIALGLVGAIVVARGVLNFVTFVASTFILPGIPLTRFGAKPKARGQGASWAIVTGATDGIGREFALQLARAGFNILLASRTAEKLQKVAAEVEAQASGVQTRVHTIDFVAGDEKQYAALEGVINELDVGVLINNVGKSNEMPVPFADQDKQEMLDIAEINIMATLRMTRTVAPLMTKRRRGLILNVGSFSGQFTVPLLTTYSATKAFLIAYSQALGNELSRSNVVVQNTNTYFVTTNLSKLKRSTYWIPTPKLYVTSVLRKIGRGGGAINRPYNTTPYPSHAIVDYLLSITVSGTHYLLNFNYNSLMKIRQRALKRAAKSQ